MELSREDILGKTHYGLKIYAHVLRHYYPGSTVLSFSGRDCLLTKNPFNEDKPTLKIQIANNCAVHYDLENSISTGDAFTFAALHYKIEGEVLHKKLNEDLYLRIDKQSGLYRNQNETVTATFKIPIPVFSYFKAPVSNTIPIKEINLLQVYHLLIGKVFADCTDTLRNLKEPQDARKYKANHFDYVTFSGTFSKRNDKSLLKHSGLIAIDFDHVSDLPELKKKLLQDEYLETELMFVSPSGDGLKWIVPIDLTKAKHQDYFKGISNYLRQTYQLEIDQSGKDISRACFLPQDADVFINPKYL